MNMMRVFGSLLVLAGMGMNAMATTVGVPEIDGGFAASGLAILAGGILIVRARHKK